MKKRSSKITKSDLKSIISESIKKILKEKGQSAPEPVTKPAPTTTPNPTPTKRPNPIKIPRPGTFPNPAPKAKKKELDEKFFEFNNNNPNKSQNNNNSDPNDSELIKALKSKANSESDNKLISNFNIWLNENIDSSDIEIRAMRLPSNVGGFTTKDKVFLNKSCLEGKGLNDIMFIIIHEIHHFIDIKNDYDEISKNMTERDFEKFFKYISETEIKTDNNAEAVMKRLNVESGFDEDDGIEKQPFDLSYYISQYKSFMQQFHTMFHNNRHKYNSFSDIQKEMAFGSINENRVIKIPKPGTFPKKKTISENKPVPEKEAFLIESKKIKLIEEKQRMNALIQEAPMNIEPGGERPHDLTKKGIEGKTETPFSNIDLFSKKVLNQSTLEKLGSEEFNAIMQNVNRVGKLTPMAGFNMIQLVCTYEKRNRPALENLAKSIVKNKFGLPDEIMDKIDAELVDFGGVTVGGDNNDNNNQRNQENNRRNPEQRQPQERPRNNGGGGRGNENDNPAREVAAQFTPDELAIIKKHADKRLINNILMMGSGYRAHQIFEDIKQSLDAIDNRLYPLYKKVMPNMELNMWTWPIEKSFGSRIVGGKCELGESEPEDDNQDEDLGLGGDENEEQNENPENENPNEQGEENENQRSVTAKASAIIFPILLHEVAKGAVEILLLQHLADVQAQYGEKVAKEVVKRADSYYDEHWLKLIGPRLWKYLHDALIYVVHEENEDHTIIAYVLNRMASMEPEEVVSLLDDSIYNGPAAIEKIKHIFRTIREEIDAYENQNDEVPTPEEIGGGENHDTEIANLLATENPLENKPEVTAGNKKKLQDMDITELNDALQSALEVEDYKKAAKVRDEINSRHN